MTATCLQVRAEYKSTFAVSPLLTPWTLSAEWMITASCPVGPVTAAEARAVGPAAATAAARLGHDGPRVAEGAGTIVALVVGDAVPGPLVEHPARVRRAREQQHTVMFMVGTSVLFDARGWGVVTGTDSRV